MSFPVKNSSQQSCMNCSFCGGFKIVTYGHRQSEFHQRNVGKKLKIIAMHISSKKTKLIKVHDIDWPNKDDKRFCHFCNDKYFEHGASEDFMIESLGSLNHHHSALHQEAVKKFLKENKRKENFVKYVYSSDELNGFLENASEAKKRYLKKMDIINSMVIKQIKETECSRKDLLDDTMVSIASSSHVSHTSNENALPQTNLMKRLYLPQEQVKIPPWLIDEKSGGTVAISENSRISSTFTSTEQPAVTSAVGPSMDTLLKHIYKEQKKGLPTKRIKANIKNLANRSSKWRPVFHGIWNKSRHCAQKKSKFSTISHQ